MYDFIEFLISNFVPSENVLKMGILERAGKKPVDCLVPYIVKTANLLM
jgi:hypothetical protein